MKQQKYTLKLKTSIKILKHQRLVNRKDHAVKIYIEIYTLDLHVISFKFI